MSRPDDIPQDVWEAAMSVVTSVRPDMNGLAVVLGSECFDALLTNMARAIMAAKAAERERCANVAVARSDHKRAHCDDACVCDNGYHVAVAIRAGA